MTVHTKLIGEVAKLKVRIHQQCTKGRQYSTINLTQPLYLSGIEYVMYSLSRSMKGLS